MSSEQNDGHGMNRKAHWQRLLSRLAAYLRVTAGAAALLSNSAAWAQQLPSGGTVAVGSATISAPQNGTLNINQSSNQAVINWNSFSVGRNDTVNFNQPNAASATLNRVVGSTPSWIAGTINAPGTVLLVNPNGIAITKSGVVNTGSFAASTLDISNADFMAGRYKFTGNGGSAAVRNAGRINVSDGGFAALLGGQVANDGVISARLGKVGMGAGELITLDLAGDGFLSVAVPSSQLGKLVDRAGALVSNRGKIRADGGSVYLTAATASNILRDAVNVPGSIRANTVGTHQGRIFIGGGTGGRVSVNGKLTASGGSKRGGGQIAVTGAKIDLGGKIRASGKVGGSVTATGTDELRVQGTVSAAGKDGAGGRIDLTAANVAVIGSLIDASGTTSGGLVRIGGTYQGGNGNQTDPLYQSYVGRFGALPDIAAAQIVYVDAGSTINISARNTGDAGSAIFWSEQGSFFAGSIGGNGLNGGYAEISSRGALDVIGSVNLTAAAGGRAGTLLLDPTNVTISTTANANESFAGGTYTPSGSSGANIQASVLLGQLNAGTSVIVSTTSAGSQAGTIAVNTALNWTGTASLTLNATSTITIAGAITATSGTLALNAAATTGTNAITISSAINVAALSMNQTRTTTQSAAITAGTLTLSGSGATYTLTQATNNIGSVSASVGAGTVSLTSNSDYSISGITATTVNLTAGSGKTVSQTGAITATSLTLSGANAAYNLSSPTNSITTLAGGATASRLASVTFVNSKALTVNTVGSVNVLAATGAINLTANGATADITVSRAISTTYAGSGSGITLTAGRDIKINNALTAASATGSAITLTAARNIELAGAVTANVGLLTLKAGNNSNAHATIRETGGTGLYVDRLLLTTAATTQANGPDVSLGYVLNSNSSDIILSTIAGSVGSLNYYGFQNPGLVLTIGTIGSTVGLTAAGDITLQSSNGDMATTAAITTPGNLFIMTGALSLGASVSANSFSMIAGVTANANATVSVSSFNLYAGSSWKQVGPLAAFSATDFLVEGANTAWGIPAATFVRATGGDGSTANPYVLVDVYGLQGAGSTPDKSFKLGSDINASAAAGWNGGAGFRPIGMDSYGAITQYSGTFDGAGHSISGLTVNAASTLYVGLFSQNSGTIQNLTLSGINVSGYLGVGGLVGSNAGMVSNVSVSGTVNGASFAIGGLAGANSGVVTGSSSTATINAQSASDVGGLVGDNYASITNSFATGPVHGYSVSGGLAGYNAGTISGSYAAGQVDGPYIAGSSSYLGGLVGLNSGSIVSSHANGNVVGTLPATDADYNGGNWDFGGLAGKNLGTISNSYATGDVTGMISVGGLVGSNGGTAPGGSTMRSGTINGSYATGNVYGNDTVGGLVGLNGGTATIGGQDQTIAGTIADSHATGTVTGIYADTMTQTRSSSSLGGLVGVNPGEIARSFATGAVSGGSLLGGLVGVNQGTTSSIHEAFATGDVTSSNGDTIGGLIGMNEGNVTNAYAKGNVSGGFYVGGLIGVHMSGAVSSVYSTGVATATFGPNYGAALISNFSGGTIANAYWDSTTAGLVGFNFVAGDASGAQGLTTAQLKQALPSGFSSAFWGIVPNASYPYLLIQPGVVSGTVYATYGGATAGAGVVVSELVNGAGTTTIQTDANGRYSFFLSDLANGGELLVFTNSGASYRQNVTAAVVLDIYGGYLAQTTAGSSASSLSAGLATAIGGNATAQAVVNSANNRAYNLLGGAFVFDQSVGANGANVNTLVIAAAGAVTQSAAIYANNVALTGTGATYTLNNGGNQIGRLAANTGSLSITDSVTLTINAVAGFSGINATGDVTLTSDALTLTGTVTAAGNVTLAPKTAGTAIFVGTGAGAYVVTAADIARVFANTLVIGNASAGALTVNQSITPNSSNLALVSGGAVSQAAGTAINVGGLGVQGTTITLSGTTTATSFASSSTSAPTLNVTGSVTIAAIGPINGISWTDSTTATIRATGTITVAAAIKNSGGGSLVLYADSAASGSGDIAFTGAGIIDFSGNSGNVSLYYHPSAFPNATDFSSNVTMGTGAMTAYMLVDSASDLQNINNNLSGSYALNRNLDLAGFGNFVPLSDGSSTFFNGLLDGQFYTISNLTVARPDSSAAGLVGFNSGIIRNLGLSNVNISGQFGAAAGGVAGYNTGVIDQVYVTGMVSGASFSGGVAGFQYGSGSISNTFANVRVVGDNNATGGLVGLLQQFGSISQSIAVGYATGTGSVGGLIGDFSNSPTVTNSYWDRSTVGVTTDVLASSANGMTTAALQGTLPGGFNSSIWGTGAGLYPYLKGFYPVAAPKAVSGTVYSDRGVTPVAGGTVATVVNGINVGAPYTGANGYYYALLPSLGTGSEVVAYTTGAAAGVSYTPGATATVSGLNVYGGYQTVVTGASALSAVPALVANATVRGIASGLANVEYDLTAANFAIDQAMALSGKVLVFNTTGTVTQTSGITVSGAGSGLLLFGTGATYTLTGANNVSTLAANTGTVNFNNGANALSIGTLAGTAGVTTTGSLTVSDSGTVTQATGGIVNGNLVLQGGGTFTLTQAGNAITTLAGSVGTINLVNGSALTVGTVGGTVGLTSAGTVTLAANAMTISSALSAAGQTVNLLPRTAATAIGLGSGGTLTLTQASLNNITAATLVIGSSTTSGTITVNGSVSAPSGVTNLTLMTSGTATISAAATLGNPNANGTITIQANTVTFANATTSKITANSSNGTVVILPLTATRTMSIAGSGNINLAATVFSNSEISAANFVFGGVTATGGLSVSANATLTSSITNISLINSAVTIASGATLTNANANGSISIQADTVTFVNVSTSKLTANSTSGTISIAPISANRTLSLAGAGQLNLAATLFSNAEITAANFVFGGAGANGALTVGGAVTASSITNLTLWTSGSVTLNAALTDTVANGSITLRGGNLALNAALTANNSSGTVVLNGSGSVTQTTGITAAKLLLQGGAFALTTPGNSIGTLAGAVGSLNFSQNAALTIGAVNGVQGVSGTGAVTIGGTALTIANGSRVSGTNVVLASSGAFVNNQGSDAVTASTRWLVYSSAPGNDTFGGLDSGNRAIWNSTFASLPPANVTGTGNVYIFAYQPTLTFTSTDVAKTYGDSATISGAYAISGLQAGVTNAYLGDTAAAVYSGAPTVASAGAAGTADVAGGPYAITVSSTGLTGLAGYAFAFTSTGQLTVGQRAVTVTADAQNRSYGDSNPALTYTTSSLGAGTAITGSLATTATASSDVGAYAITQGGVTNAANANYTITYTGADLTIGRRAVTVTADAQAKTYGDANPALTYTTSSLGAGIAITGSLATTATATSDVGAYAITQGGVTNAANANYTITYAGADLTIGRRAVTVTADAQSRWYGDSNPALTFTTSSIGAGTAITGALATTATASSDVGAYAITQGGVTNAANTNYTITYAGADLTIGRRAVTVTADAQNRSYGDSNPALTFTTSSLGAGTAITGSLATTATASSDVGAYAITQGGVTNAANTNYTITYAGADLTIGRRAVTVTADALSKIYGDANPALTYTTTSLGAGTAITGSLATTATASSDVGAYAITQGGVTNAANANYTITYTGADLTIGRRAVTVTADAQSRWYGDSNPALTFTTSSLGAGIAITGSLTTTATASSDVGAYAITQGGVTNAANTNYTITYAGSDLTIGRRAVTVTADAQAKTYGDANPALTFTTSSLGAGTAITGSLTTTATASSDVGAYAITQGGVTNAANTNYTITYTGADLTIGRRAVTVTADAQTKTYGDANPALTFTTSSLGAGTAITGSLATTATASSDVGAYAITQGGVTNAANTNYTITYAGADLTIGRRAVTVTADAQNRSYGDSNPALTFTTSSLGAGTAITGSLATTATASSDVGAYAITQGGVTNAANTNYTITYTGADLTIGQRAVTVTADAQNRSYGDSNPALTFTTSSLGAGTAIIGSLATTATGSSDFGAYAITQGGVTNAANANYSITYTGADLTIGQRAVTVTADAQAKTYGAVDLGLTYTSTSLGQGAALAGALATAPASSDAGAYAITQGGITNAANPNYRITYIGATLTIDRALLTIRADDKTRVVNAPNPALTATYLGLVNGDTSSAASGLLLSTLADVNSPAGGYAINASGATARNYTIRYVPGTMAVTDTGTTTVPTSQVSPTSPVLQSNALTIPSFNAPGGVAQISFTPPVPARVASTPSTDISPAALPAGQSLATNNGLTYPPINQFDANQYSSFKLPDYAAQAGEAAVYVMIARGVDRDHAADSLVDTFWNGTTGAWTPPQTFAGKVTFSDGDGNVVNPTGHTGFPIVAGKTDFGQLLKSGPVMISDGAMPAHWLLAIQLTADGKGIVANDPASGKQVVLNYDAATKTVGGVISVFDADSQKFTPFAEASAALPSLASLQSFVPAHFLAVSTK